MAISFYVRIGHQRWPFSINLKINLGSVLNSESKICSKSFPERSNSTRFEYFSKEGTLDSELYPRLRILTSSGISNLSIELKYFVTGLTNDTDLVLYQTFNRTESSGKSSDPFSPDLVHTWIGYESNLHKVGHFDLRIDINLDKCQQLSQKG